MSGSHGTKSRRGARNNADGHYMHRKMPDSGMNSSAMVSAQVPYYAMAPHSYYQELPMAEPMPYMVPFMYQQHQQHHPQAFISNPAIHMREALTNGNNNTHAPTTPPLKRVRTDFRSNAAVARSAESYRGTPSCSQKSTPSKSTASRKTFSDFRIASISIGTWTSSETKAEPDTRDSRIRFCFRNSSDKDPDSTLSATEAALVAPDRLSISVCRGSRRIIIPAHHIKGIKFSRLAGEIDIETDGWAAFEKSARIKITDHGPREDSPTTKQSQGGIPSTLWELTEDDVTEGQLAKTKVMKIKLDQDRPLTEPKWTRGSLADHIDVNSRFLKIIRIMDAEASPTLATLLDQWAGDDSERAYFYEYHLSSERLARLLTNLMSMSNILTPALLFLIENLLQLVKLSDISEDKVVKIFKDALFLIPDHMLRMSLDFVYAEFCETHFATSPRTSLLIPAEAHLGGSKRQRGESEVPSEQLARTTLDEKRRRLSDSDPQLPVLVRSKSRVRRDSSVMSTAQCMQTSRSHDSMTNLPAAASKLTISAKAENHSEDGARMSREEMLRALEDYEDHAASSDTEANEQDAPVEAAAIVD